MPSLSDSRNINIILSRSGLADIYKCLDEHRRSIVKKFLFDNDITIFGELNNVNALMDSLGEQLLLADEEGS